MTNAKNKRVPLWAFSVLSLLLALASLGLSIGAFLHKGSFTVGTVDMQEILGSVSATLVQSYPNGSVPKPVMESVIEELKEDIHTFGKEHNLLIFSKGALLSGDSKECTAALLETLSTQRDGDQ